MTNIKNRYRAPLYWAGRGIVWTFFRLAYKVTIIDVHKVPKNGPLVVGSNHVHNFDPLVVGIAAPRYVHFMAKHELFKYRLFDVVLRYFGAFPVRRGHNDKQAIRQAIAVPANNGCIVVFPEGHRSPNGKLQKGLPGIAFIARKSGCPVVPVAVMGEYKFRRPLIVRFGDPFVPSPDDTNEAVLETLMGKIQELLDKGPRA